jgi:hypothetical protein
MIPFYDDGGHLGRELSYAVARVADRLSVFLRGRRTKDPTKIHDEAVFPVSV